jgi:hypothetical protein
MITVGARYLPEDRSLIPHGQNRHVRLFTISYVPALRPPSITMAEIGQNGKGVERRLGSR